MCIFGIPRLRDASGAPSIGAEVVFFNDNSTNLGEVVRTDTKGPGIEIVILLESKILGYLDISEVKFIVGGKREHFHECPNVLALSCFSIHGLVGGIFMVENQREPNTDGVFLSASKCSFLSLGVNLWARVCSAKFPNLEIWLCRTGEPSVPAVHRFWHGGSRVLPTRAVDRCQGARCKLRF